MKFEKAGLSVGANTVSITTPIVKVDESRRTVSGFATLDNIDNQGDVVLAEASQKAFNRFRGNIREQHDASKAVGRLVGFEEQEYFHDGEFYRGIFVSAYVSEGAPDTWTKVLDGTLTGFSIGGEIVKSSNEFVKEAERTVRFVEDYELVELSLVDNPANQLANVLSIQKAENGSVTVKGMAVDTPVENVLFCEKDETVRVGADESGACLECGLEMKNIGWIETGANREEKVRSVIAKHRNPEATEGGVNVGRKKEENEVTKTENVEEVETPEVSDETTSVEKEVEPETVEEVQDESEEIEKKIDSIKDDLSAVIHDSFEKSRGETNEAVSALETRIEELSKNFESKTSEFEKKLDELGKSLSTEKSRLSELEKSLKSINSKVASRKSSELDSEATKIKKSDNLWNGAFSLDDL